MENYTHSELLTKFRDQPSYCRFLLDMQRAGIGVCVFVQPGVCEAPAVMVKTGEEYSALYESTQVALKQELLAGPSPESRGVVIYP